MKRITSMLLYAMVLSIPLAGLYYTLPRQIHVQYPAVKYRLGVLEEAQLKVVEVDGSVQRRYFEHNRFRGTLVLGEERLESLDVVLNPDGALLMVRDEETGRLVRYGVLYALDDFSRFTIAVLEPVVMFGVVSRERFWDTNAGMMVSAPANNREEALRVSNELMGNLLEKPLE